MWGPYLEAIVDKGLNKEYFLNYFLLFTRNTLNKAYNLLNFYENDEKNLALLEKIGTKPDLDDIVSLVSEEYSANTNLSDSTIVFACRNEPGIDVIAAEIFASDLFSCTDVQQKYGSGSSPTCTAANENEQYTTQPLMFSEQSRMYVCHKGMWINLSDGADKGLDVVRSSEMAQTDADDEDEFELDSGPEDDVLVEETRAKTTQDELENMETVPSNVEIDYRKYLKYSLITIASLTTVAGVILSLEKNAKAKKLSEEKVYSERELDEKEAEIENAQQMRAWGIGLTIFGAIGLGLSIAF